MSMKVFICIITLVNIILISWTVIVMNIIYKPRKRK